MSRAAFELVSDETRLGILQVLAERLRESPEQPTMRFSDLRRAVGVRDSGNFNYHLGQLTGGFVTQTDDGYRIGAAGLRVVAAVLSGVYDPDATLGPVTLSDPCPVCEDDLRARYADGLVRVVCAADADHRFRIPLPPRAVEDRSLEEVLTLVTRKMWRDLDVAVAGSCPLCYNRLEWAVSGAAEREVTEFDTQCSQCGAVIEVPAVAVLFGEPTAVAFFADHGVSLHEQPPWAAVLVEPVSLSHENGSLTLTVALDDRLRARLDESLGLRSIERVPG